MKFSKMLIQARTERSFSASIKLRYVGPFILIADLSAAGEGLSV